MNIAPGIDAHAPGYTEYSTNQAVHRNIMTFLIILFGLSISISGGKETNRDCLSNGE